MAWKRGEEMIKKIKEVIGRIITVFSFCGFAATVRW